MSEVLSPAWIFHRSNNSNAKDTIYFEYSKNHSSKVDEDMKNPIE